MLVHGLLVERVDLRRLGGSAGGNDVLGDRFDGCQAAPGEKEAGPLGRKGACDSAADRASGSVDHRNLVLQHHLRFLSPSAWKRQRVWLNISPRPDGGDPPVLRANRSPQASREVAAHASEHTS